MKNIVIFGACSAIAQATARLWAKDGANFVLLDRDAERLTIVADDLKSRGAKMAHTLPVDLTEMEKHPNLIQQIHQHLTTTHPSTPSSGSRSPLQPTTYLFAYGTLGNQKKR